MNETSIKSILNDIRLANDKKITHKLLVKIRMELQFDSDGISLFWNSGGIRALIDVLKHIKNEKILEVALSILGNCCTKLECAQEAYKFGIIPLIMTILNINNTIIQTRGFRLLGNLAKTNEICKAIQSKNAANMCTILLKEQNANLLSMIIRLISKLWIDKKFQNDIVALGSVRKIIEVLLKYSRNENAKIKTEDEEIFDPTRVKIKTQNGSRTVTRQKFNDIIRDIDTNKNSNIMGYELETSEKNSFNDQRFRIPDNKEDHFVLIESILKCVPIISKRLNTNIAEQLYGDGNGYLCFVYFGNINSPFRSLSLQILANIADNFSARYLLGSADVVLLSTTLLTCTNLKKPLDQQETHNCIRILCLLTCDSCNRAKLRRSGALDILLKRTSITKCEKELGMILFAFYQFRFDQISMELLIDNGLVKVLIKLLSDYINTKLKIEHIKNIKEKDIFQKLELKKSRELSPTMNFSVSKYIKFDNYDPESPGSSSGYSSSYYLRSPTNITKYAPRIDLDTDFDSDTYSPVCSDNDDEEEQIDKDVNRVNDTKITDINDISIGESSIFDIIESNDSIASANNDEFKLNSDYLDNDTESTNFTAEMEENDGGFIKECNFGTCRDFEKNPIPPILTLLHNATIRNTIKYTTDFINPETLCLSTLLKLSQLIPQPMEKLSTILTNILNDSKNFKPILQQDFVYNLRELVGKDDVHNDCKSCQEMKLLAENLMKLLGEVGESGYGRGEIAHYLLTGEKNIQTRAAILTTYIIKTPTILYTLLKECRALDIVLDTILQEKYLSNEASLGLTTLANNLNIGKNITNTVEKTTTTIETTTELLIDSDETATTFVCDCIKKIKKTKKINDEVYEDEYLDIFDGGNNICNVRDDWGDDELITFVINNNKKQQIDNNNIIVNLNDIQIIKDDEDKVNIDNDVKQCKKTVTVKQEEQRIEFSKTILTECSDVFNTMLTSDFKESKDKQVYLSDVSYNGLNYFLHLIIIKTKMKNLIVKKIPLAKKMDWALESLELSIKYMLNDIELLLFNVIKLMINETNAINVFEWSLQHINQHMLDIAINYYLTSNISGVKKVKLFRDTLNTKYFNNWRQLITETILVNCLPDNDIL